MANSGGLMSTVEIISNLCNCRIKLNVKYSETAKKALKYHLPFTTSYLCEECFSSVISSKRKLWSRLDVIHTLLSLSLVNSRWDLEVAGKQA